MLSDTPLGSFSMQLRHICLEYPYAQLEAATDGFHESRRLGSGTAGTVYRADMPDSSEVAVKVIDLATLGDDSMVAGFEEEIAVLSKFRHPNLVVLMGWAREGTRRFLIYEFLCGGDVFQRLAKARMEINTFLWHERLAVARSAATGLAHLHNSNPHAFHRDVKSANILLAGGGSAKMADFGLSCVAKKEMAQEMVCEHPSGTPGYTCPTYIRTGKVSESSEVYSFGMVLLEMLLNMMPAGMMNGEIVYPIYEAIKPSEPGCMDRIIMHVDKLARWPHVVASDVAQLAMGCIHPDETVRPKFNEVCQRLKGIQDRNPPIDYASQAVPVMPRQRAYIPPVVQESFAPTPSGPSAVPAKPATPDISYAGPAVRPGAPSGVPQQDLASWAAARGAAKCGESQQGIWAPGPERQSVDSSSPIDFASGPLPGRSPNRTPSPRQGDESISPPKRPTIARAAAAAAKAGMARQSSPSASSDAWPTGADIALEVVYVHGIEDLASLPPQVRAPSIVPTVDESGNRTLRLGRHSQQAWFEALLDDASKRNSVSRVACSIVWDGPANNGAPLLRTIGTNLLVVDGKIITQDQTTTLRPGSRIRFMFQSENDLADLLTIEITPSRVSHDSSMSNGGYTSSQPQQATDESPRKTPPGEAWELDLVYAAGLSPEAFMAVPLETRQFGFVLSPSRPSVVIGRQHQIAMFEALVASKKELLSFVSRSHLQIELAEDGALLVTNLSQNISIAGSTDILGHGSGAKLRSGDVISFAAEAAMVPGAEPTPIVTADGVERALAPFLTFRLIKR